MFTTSTKPPARPVSVAFGISPVKMTELEFIQQIRKARSGEASDYVRAFDLALEALDSYPYSARLLCDAGDLLQLTDEEQFRLDDALLFYERAAAADPRFAEAFESIGYYHDVHTHDFDAAERAFRMALSLENREDTVLGLARVMAERGENRVTIQKLLDQATDQGSARLLQMRNEINGGEWEPSDE